MSARDGDFEGTDSRLGLRTRSANPVVLLPRELGQVPPAAAVVGARGRALCQLLTLKARVPRFGIVVVDAFDQHLKHRDVADAVDAAEAATVVDDAMLIGLGEQVTRAILRTPLSTALARGLDELRRAFPDDDVFAIRASVVGDPAEVDALAGVLEPALGVRNIAESVHRLFSLAFHPRTLQARRAIGLPIFQTRLAVVVQRLVHAEQSGLCWSVDVAADVDDRRHRPRARLRACHGLAGGAGGVRGNARVAYDAFFVERAVDADQGLADDARVEAQPVRKIDALRVDATAEKTTARTVPLEPARASDASLSTVQARLVAREALRLEAAFGKPQAMTFAFAGRLLHVLDVEPLLVARTRIESDRQRTWDERLVPGPLSRQPSSTLTFSVWQRGIARGLERAGRLLGVRGVLLEEMRPQFRRVLGVVTGRITGNVEVLVALLDLLPFADKAREAISTEIGQEEVRALKAAPPPGFWQRARVKIEENRWPSQLERLSQVATGESLRFADEVRAALAELREVDVADEDPDTLQDRFDALEEALGRCVAALALSGMLAALYREELRGALVDVGVDASFAEALLLPDDSAVAPRDIDGDVVVGVRRLHSLVRLVDDRPALRALFSSEAGAAEILAALGDDSEPAFAELRRGLAAHVDADVPEGILTLDEPRLAERPERLVQQLARLVRSSRAPAGRLEAANARRREAATLVDAACERMGGLRTLAARKRCANAVDGVLRHTDDLAALWVPTERVVAGLRRVALALGERLFEHGLIDQPRDVLHLQDAEVAGVIRGTAPDVDVRPLVAARRRAVVARPPTMARRVETHGVVATSLLLDDEGGGASAQQTGAVDSVAGSVAVVGSVEGRACVLDRADGSGGGALRPASGVVIASALGLSELPLVAVADAVVVERGAALSPVAHALRALGVPMLVEANGASLAFADGDAVVVDGPRLRRAGPVAAAPERSSPPSAAPPFSPSLGPVTAPAADPAPVRAREHDGQASTWPSTSTEPAATSSSSTSVAPGVEDASSESASPSSKPPALASAAFEVGPLVVADGRTRARAARPGDISGEMAEPPAAGLHHVTPAPPPPMSGDGEPIVDADVVSEEDAS
jgi:pyruvate,water dikinase